MKRMALIGFFGICVVGLALSRTPDGAWQFGVADADAKSLKKSIKKVGKKIEAEAKKALPKEIRMIADKKYLQAQVEKEIDNRMPEIEQMVTTAAEGQIGTETEKGVETQVSSAAEIVKTETDAFTQTERAIEQKVAAAKEVAANLKDELLSTAMAKLALVRVVVTTSVKQLLKKALDTVFEKTVVRTFRSIRSPLETKVTAMITSAVASATAGFGAAAAPLIKESIARGFDKVQAKLLVRFRAKIEKKMERFVDKMADKAMARLKSNIEKRVEAVWSRLLAKAGKVAGIGRSR